MHLINFSGIKCTQTITNSKYLSRFKFQILNFSSSFWSEIQIESHLQGLLLVLRVLRFSRLFRIHQIYQSKLSIDHFIKFHEIFCSCLISFQFFSSLSQFLSIFFPLCFSDSISCHSVNFF